MEVTIDLPSVFLHCPSSDEQQRICEILHPTVRAVIRDEVGVGRTFPSTFQADIIRHIDDNMGDATRLALIISVHGDGEGCFIDHELNQNQGRFLWTPEKYWNGFQSHLSRFPGLRDILSLIRNNNLHTVEVICAQCCGSYFADKLRTLIENNPPESQSISVHAIGLSYGNTWSVQNDEATTLGTFRYHADLARYLAGTS